MQENRLFERRAVIDGEEVDMIHHPQMKEYFVAIVR